MKRLFPFFYLFILGCKKDGPPDRSITINITGRITDKVNGTGISGDVVELWSIPIPASGGFFNPGSPGTPATMKANTITDNNGKYSLKVTTEPGYLFRIKVYNMWRCLSLGKIDDIFSMPGMQMKLQHDTVINFSFGLEAWLRFTVQNELPSNKDDLLELTISQDRLPYMSCRFLPPVSRFVGDKVDTSFIFSIESNNLFTLDKYIRSGATGTFSHLTQQLMVNAGDTLALKIIY